MYDVYDYDKVLFSSFEQEISNFSFKTEDERNLFMLAYQKLKSSILLSSMKADIRNKEVLRCTVLEEDVSDVHAE